MSTLGVKLEEYWKAIRHKKGIDSTLPMEDMLLVYTYCTAEVYLPVYLHVSICKLCFVV